MRYIVYIVVAVVIALPAQALTFDLWNSLEQAAFRLLNADRAGQSAGALTADDRLHNAARAHSQDMASNNFFDHTGSNGSSAGDRITAGGYKFASWGENIAAGQETAADVITAWLKSPAHRDNMRDPSFTDVGIGLAEAKSNADFSSYWTMVLASGDSASNGLPVAGIPPSKIALISNDGPVATAETPTEMPLPPAIWLFAVALTCALLVARRESTVFPHDA